MNRNSTFSPEISEILSKYKNAIVQLDKQSGGYTERLDLLRNAWQWGSSLAKNCSEDAVSNIGQRLLRHSLQLCFVSEWSKTDETEKNQLGKLIAPCTMTIQDKNILAKFEYFLGIYKNPWSNEKLMKILYAEEELSLEEELEIHRPEMEQIMVLRLTKLCDGDCEEYALNYARSCLRCLNDEHKEVRQVIFDLYLAILLLNGEMNGCIDEMKKMSLSDGLEFIRRHKQKKAAPKGDEITKYLLKATELATHLFLSLALADSLETRHGLITFLNILSEWLTVNRQSENFADLLRNTFSLAVSSKHLYYCAKIIEKGLPDNCKTLAIEFYIRGINLDINEIEMKKYDGDVKPEHILLLESNLSAHYLKLAESFTNNEHVRRECLLTAFSLRPVKQLFEQLQTFRIDKDSDYEEIVGDVKAFECSHVSIEATSSVSKVYCKYCGNYRDPQDDTKADILLNAENLINVPTYLHNDLIVVVGSPRLKQLSWNTPWNELARNCQRLMKEDEKIRICSQYLISSNDQLQFLELDYSMFRHLPEGEYPGIEKGYEQFLKESEEEDTDEDWEKPLSKTATADSDDKKKPKYYGEDTSDEDEIPMAMLRSRKKKKPGRPTKKEDKGDKIDHRFGIKKFINHKKQNVPFKKRLVQKLKPDKAKFKFNYLDPHAKFYIAVRKAQLDCKKQRIKLIYAKSNKTTRRYFYEMVNKAKNEPVRREVLDFVKNRPRYRPVQAKPFRTQLPSVSLNELLIADRLNMEIVQVLEQTPKANRRKTKQIPKDDTTIIPTPTAHYSRPDYEAAEALTQMAHLLTPPSHEPNNVKISVGTPQPIDYYQNSIKRTAVLAEQNGQNVQPAKKSRIDSASDSDTTPKRGRGRPPGAPNKIKYNPDGTPVIKVRKPRTSSSVSSRLSTDSILPISESGSSLIEAVAEDSDGSTSKKICGAKVKPLEPQRPNESDADFSARKNQFHKKLVRNALNRQYRAKKRMERLSNAPQPHAVSSSDSHTPSRPVSPSPAMPLLIAALQQTKTESAPLDLRALLPPQITPERRARKQTPKAAEATAAKPKPCTILEPQRPDETAEEFARREEDFKRRQVRNEKERERRRRKKEREQLQLNGNPVEVKSEIKLEIPIQYVVSQNETKSELPKLDVEEKLMAMEIPDRQPDTVLMEVEVVNNQQEPPKLEHQTPQKETTTDCESITPSSFHGFDMTTPLKTEEEEIPKIEAPVMNGNSPAHIEAIDFESLIKYENLAVARSGKKVIVTSTVPSTSQQISDAQSQTELMKFLLKKSSPPPPLQTIDTKKAPKNKTPMVQTVNYMTKFIPTKLSAKLSVNDWIESTRKPDEVELSQFIYGIGSNSENVERPSMIQQRRDYLPQDSMIQARCNYLKTEKETSFFREVTEFFRKETTMNVIKNDRKNYKNEGRKLNQRVPIQKCEKISEKKEKMEKDPKNVLDYLIRTVPGMNSMEFFELPEPEKVTVKIIHIKNGTEASTATTTNTPSSVVPSTSDEGQKSQTVVKQVNIQIQKSTVTKNGAAEPNAIIFNNLKVAPAKRSVIQQRIAAPVTAIANSTETTAIASTSAQGMSVTAATNSGHLLRILNSPTGVRSIVKKDEKRPESSLSNGVVQFICKTDGKVIHLTPITNTIFQAQGQSTAPSTSTTITSSTVSNSTSIVLNSLVKTPVPVATDDDDPNGINTRSVYEENYANFIRKNPPKSVSAQTLPKFNHVFTSTGTTVVVSSAPKDRKDLVRPTVLQAPRPREVAPLRIQVPLVPRGGVQRIVRPFIQLNSNMLKTDGGSVVITTPRFPSVSGQQVLLTTPSTPKVDNSTLEQLREFDMVLEQVKERSAVEPPAIEPPKTEIVYSNSTNSAPVLQKLMFIQQQKPNSNLGTPLVVVTNYQNPPKSISPAPSVSSSTIGSPGSAKSAPETPQKVLKPVKRETFPPTKSSPLPKLSSIQKPQEDEQTVQRIYDILAEYAEQLRNSPDLNNKPAPRRRSNPPTNPQTPGKKKKSKKGSDVNSDFELSDDTSSRPGSVSGVPSTSSHNFSPSDPDVSQLDSDTSQSEKPQFIKIESREEAPTEKPQPPPHTLLMPGNYLLPFNLLKNGRQFAILTSANGSKILAALPNSPQKSMENEKLFCLRTVPNTMMLNTTETQQPPVIISPKRRVNGEAEPTPEAGPSYQQTSSKVILSDQKMSDAAQNTSELDKQLKLQKSLSEECEDLGVDEPEDLFPDADLLFDTLEHSLPSKELDCLDVDIGASTEIESSSHARTDLYEYTDEEFQDDDYRHKKLRLQPPIFSYKRKRNAVAVTPKKTKTESSDEVVTRRASARGHVKKNCKCCKTTATTTTTVFTVTQAASTSKWNNTLNHSNSHNNSFNRKSR